MFGDELMKELAKLGKMSLDVHQDAADLIHTEEWDYEHWQKIQDICYKIYHGYEDLENYIHNEYL